MLEGSGWLEEPAEGADLGDDAGEVFGAAGVDRNAVGAALQVGSFGFAALHGVTHSSIG